MVVVATNGLMTILLRNSERSQVSFGYRPQAFVTGRMGDDTFVKKRLSVVSEDVRSVCGSEADAMKEWRLAPSSHQQHPAQNAQIAQPTTFHASADVTVPSKRAIT